MVYMATAHHVSRLAEVVARGRPIIQHIPNLNFSKDTDMVLVISGMV